MPEDAASLVELMHQAAGDTLQFILDELDPRFSPADVFRHMISSSDSECSYRRCWVAVAQSGAHAPVVGMVNAFPASLLCDQTMPTNLSARELHLWPRTVLQDASSYCINSLAVFPLYRRCGIASRLIDQAAEQAVAEGFASLSLHVWADNASAVRLYRSKGFKELDRALIPWHPRLPHSGGSLLMRLSGLPRSLVSPVSWKSAELASGNGVDSQGAAPSCRLTARDKHQ